MCRVRNNNNFLYIAKQVLKSYFDSEQFFLLNWQESRQGVPKGRNGRRSLPFKSDEASYANYKRTPQREKGNSMSFCGCDSNLFASS